MEVEISYKNTNKILPENNNLDVHSTHTKQNMYNVRVPSERRSVSIGRLR